MGDVGTACPDRGASEQASPAPGGGPGTRAASRRADGGTCGSSDRGPDRRAADDAVARRAFRPPGLLSRPLAARCVVDLELLEALPVARKDHDARPFRQRSTTRQEHDGNEQRNGSLHHSVRGGTLTHASGHDGAVG